MKLPLPQRYLIKVKDLGFNPEYFFYHRHTQFKGEPCDICGSPKLISGVGRYISFDPEREDDLAIFICGHCLKDLETKYGVKTDME